MAALDLPVSPCARWRASAAILAFGAFAVGTDGFVISGLLPEVARTLHVDVGAAGQLVTVFALAYALLAPVLAALTATWSPRRVLVAALIVFAVGNALTATAPGYGLVLASRAVTAAGAALFTATASTTAAALAGERNRGRAIATVMTGMTSSLVLGAPLGTLIGGALGWRTTMWFITSLALAAVPPIGLRLPGGGPAPYGGLRRRVALLGDRRVLAALARTVVAFTGIHIPYTYVSAIFDGVGHALSGLFSFAVTTPHSTGSSPSRRTRGRWSARCTSPRSTWRCRCRARWARPGCTCSARPGSPCSRR